MVTLDGSPVAHAFGVPRMNANDLVTDDEHFHLGSNSKTRRGTGTERRHAFAAWVLLRPPAGRPGKFMYSNGGYGIAAALAEHATGSSWERLLQQRLFDRLGIPALAVRIGWPGLAGAAPWGHVADGRACGCRMTPPMTASSPFRRRWLRLATCR